MTTDQAAAAAASNSERILRLMLRTVAVGAEVIGTGAIVAAAFLVDLRLGIAASGTVAIVGAQLVDRFADTLRTGSNVTVSKTDRTA